MSPVNEQVFLPFLNNRDKLRKKINDEFVLAQEQITSYSLGKIYVKFPQFDCQDEMNGKVSMKVWQPYYAKFENFHQLLLLSNIKNSSFEVNYLIF